jgi:23S rRNA (uridine2552-2'-O)-methyltransferase
MRKVQDYYFKKARKENYPARSVYKLEEAQNKHRFLKTRDTVLDLGCQPGSWTIYAAKIVGPEGLVVGVDLQDGPKKSIAKAAQIVISWQMISSKNYKKSGKITGSFSVI